MLDAPLTSHNFVTLARKGFFNGLRIHRVVPDFVVQDGDPRGDAEGGPGYSIRDELNDLPYLRGTVGMALSGKDTGGSQYFLTISPAVPSLQQDAARAEGAQRYQRFITHLAQHLQKDNSLVREIFEEIFPPRGPDDANTSASDIGDDHVL